MSIKRVAGFLVIMFFLSIIACESIAQSAVDSCHGPVLPVVHFKKNKVFLNRDGRAALDSAIIMIKDYPLCRIKITGYGLSSEEGQQVSWDKVASVIYYLKSKGIAANRFIFSDGNPGNPAIVILEITMEDGATWRVAPFPCFTKYQAGRCRHKYRKEQRG